MENKDGRGVQDKDNVRDILARLKAEYGINKNENDSGISASTASAKPGSDGGAGAGDMARKNDTHMMSPAPQSEKRTSEIHAPAKSPEKAPEAKRTEVPAPEHKATPETHATVKSPEKAPDVNVSAEQNTVKPRDNQSAKSRPEAVKADPGPSADYINEKFEKMIKSLNLKLDDLSGLFPDDADDKDSFKVAYFPTFTGAADELMMQDESLARNADKEKEEPDKEPVKQEHAEEGQAEKEQVEKEQVEKEQDRTVSTVSAPFNPQISREHSSIAARGMKKEDHETSDSARNGDFYEETIPDEFGVGEVPSKRPDGETIVIKKSRIRSFKDSTSPFVAGNRKYEVKEQDDAPVDLSDAKKHEEPNEGSKKLTAEYADDYYGNKNKASADIAENEEAEKTINTNEVSDGHSGGAEADIQAQPKTVYYDIPDPEEPSIKEEREHRLQDDYDFEKSQSYGKQKRSAARREERRKSEFVVYAQKDSFISKLYDKLLSVKLRLIFSSVFFALLLLYENLQIFGVDIVAFLRLDRVYGGEVLMDTQFIVAMFLIAIPETVNAFGYLSRGRVTLELLVPLSAVYSIAYNVFAYFSDAEMHLLALPAAFVFLCAVIATYMDQKSKIAAFELVSREGEKLALEKIRTKNTEREKLALDGAVDEFSSSIACDRRTGFIDNFFARWRKNAEDHRGNAYFIAGVIIVSVIAALAASLTENGLVGAVSAMYVSFVMLCPALFVVCHKITHFFAVKSGARTGSIAVGEKALLDYSSADVMTFEDTEVIGQNDVKMKRIMLYGAGARLDKALYYLSAVFGETGGPLSSVFKRAFKDVSISPSVDMLSVGEYGFDAKVDGMKVYVGTLSYMHLKGVMIPEDDYVPEPADRDRTGFLFLAENGVLYAKVCIKYSLNKEFVKVLKAFGENGIVALVKTFDPNITDVLFASLCGSRNAVRVLRKTGRDMYRDNYKASLNSGFFSSSGKIALAKGLVSSKKYRRFYNIFRTVLLWVGAICSVAAVLASVFGVIFKLYSLAYFAWELVTVSVFAIAARGKIGPERSEEEK